LVPNAAIEDAEFRIDPVAERMFLGGNAVTADDLPLGLEGSPSVPIRPYVIFVPGRVGVLLVKQEDGVVIIDAPVSAGYARKVLEEAKWRFRGLPVKAVVNTVDGWRQMGGLREFVAAGIPIYGLDWNRPILERMIKAPFTLKPDTLARQPKEAQFTWVGARVKIGSGPGAVELVPIRGEGGERVLAVYLPDEKILYTSDMIQRSQDGGFFMASYLGEVLQMIEREKLEVFAVAGSNLMPTPLKDVQTFYDRVRLAMPGAAPAKP
jgi:hypothetical protein